MSTYSCDTRTKKKKKKKKKKKSDDLVGLAAIRVEPCLDWTVNAVSS